LPPRLTGIAWRQQDQEAQAPAAKQRQESRPAAPSAPEAAAPAATSAPKPVRTKMSAAREKFQHGVHLAIQSLAELKQQGYTVVGGNPPAGRPPQVAVCAPPACDHRISLNKPLSAALSIAEPKSTAPPRSLAPSATRTVRAPKVVTPGANGSPVVSAPSGYGFGKAIAISPIQAQVQTDTSSRRHMHARNPTRAHSRLDIHDHTETHMHVCSPVHSPAAVLVAHRPSPCRFPNFARDESHGRRGGAARSGENPTFEDCRERSAG